MAASGAIAAYRKAAVAAEKPVRVHYPMKPLTDSYRGIEMGEQPSAPFALDPKKRHSREPWGGR